MCVVVAGVDAAIVEPTVESDAAGHVITLYRFCKMVRTAPDRMLPPGWTREQHTTPSGRCYYVYNGPAHERTYSFCGACAVARGERSATRGTAMGKASIGKKQRKRAEVLHALAPIKEWPTSSHKGVKVPQSISVPAGLDLPDWTMARAQLADTGQQIVIYISPCGQLVINRSSALRMTGQLRMSQSERSKVRAEREQQKARVNSMAMSLDMFGKAAELQTVANERYTTLTQGKVPRSVHLGNWPAGAYTAHLAELFGGVQDTAKLEGGGHPVAVLDLFCGAGGLSLGLRSAGFHVFGVDSSSACIDTYRANRCGSRSLVEKLCVSDAARWGAAAVAAGLHGDLTAAQRTASLVMVGGPPCQPYSHMGTHGGTIDERDGLRTFVQMVCAMAPAIVIIENVPDMLKPKFDEQVQPLLRKLQRSGYELYAGLHACNEYGVAQRRQRTIIVGARAGAFAEGGASDAILRFKKALVCEKMSIPYSPNCADAIDTPEFWTSEEADNTPRMALETYNAREKRLTLRLSSTTGLLFATHTAPTTLSSSLSDNCYMRIIALPASVPSEDMQVRHARPINVQQMAMLHSFPPGFEVRGAQSHKAMQIANAVPPRFAHALGRALAAACQDLPPCANGAAVQALRALKIELSQSN